MPRAKRSKARAKFENVMAEFKAGTLRSSSGAPVTQRDQALAIALSESGQARPRRAKRTKRRGKG